jgi:putative ABC transport system permease protein
MLRTALRIFRRSPWFTVTAVLTIALGIGANTAIFSIVNRVVFWPLPFDRPDQLVWLATWHADRGQYSKSSAWDYSAWRQRTNTFSDVAAYWDVAYAITGTEHPEGLIGWQFTPNLFAMLGARAALGRTFVPADGQEGRDTVVVLSDSLWRQRFDADANIVGKTLVLDGRQYTIVGVMPASFKHPYASAQLWTPLTLSASALVDRKQRAFRVIARLRDGVTRAQAEAELRALAEQQAREHPDTHQGWTVSVRPIRDFYVGDARPLLWILQGTALILLFIAASNVSSLVLVRASGRQRETAVRLALGAGRLDLLRLHLTEGLVLAALGGAAGLLVALWGIHVLPSLLASRVRVFSLPETATGWLDVRVLAVTAFVTMIAGVVFGLTPLLRRADMLGEALRTGGRGATGDRRTRLVRNAIVTTQIALSVALLVGAGLLVRSFVRLQDRAFGFNTRDTVTAQLLLPRDRYASAEASGQFLNQLVTAVTALPGVESAGVINTLPLTGFNALRPYGLPGRPPEERFGEFRIVTPNYFRTMAIPIRRGRVFDDRDRVGAQEVVVINERLARRLWPNADPVGHILSVGDFLTPSPKQIIGVVGDTRHHDLARDPEPEIYRPAYQAYWPFFGLVVHGRVDPNGLERSIREAAAHIDRAVPLSNFKMLDDLAATTWEWRQSSMALLAIFAVAACVLAFVGVYGVMAYNVSQRSREIGVRLALGARPRDVARAILSQGALLTAIGIVIGLTIATTLAGLLGALLFGIAPLDPSTFAVVTLVATIAGLLATAMPALTAARVDPTVALRGE